MKNIINYYYNFKVGEIRQRDGITYFYIENIKYVFIPYTKDLTLVTGIYELNHALINRNIYTHQIILNIQGQILTYVNNEYYIMLKLMYLDGKVSLQDVLYLNNIELDGPELLKRNDWNKLWSEKNDYLEYQVSQLGKKHPIIRESFAYYLGLAETSIALVNELNLNETKLYLSHIRIKNEYSLYDLYSPLNMILDYKVRDAAEYFKSKYFSGLDIMDELKLFFMYNNLTYEEWVLFFARIMYPSYYFDKYEDIINGLVAEEEIEKIINEHESFEEILVMIYFNLRSFPNFPIIDYLENKKTSTDVYD